MMTNILFEIEEKSVQNFKTFMVLLFQDMSSLGDVRHLSQVKVETLAGEKFDQIFVLFANDLLMLSMSPRLSGYQYEVKFSL